MRFWNQPFTVTVGFYSDGTIGEVFIDAGKSGQDIQNTARDAAVVLSLALQHGTPIETIRHAVTRNSAGGPASILGAIVDALPATAGACQ
jgi:ribonucleoside-diphosphate reductase alpha chain